MNQQESRSGNENATFHRERTIIIAAAMYIALTLYANLGSLRIIALGALAVDGGSLLYPFTFTMRDLLHKKIGGRLTKTVICLAAVLNVLLFAFLWLIAVLPADSSAGLQIAYGQVLNPGFRLVIGSITATAAAELLDTLIYTKVRRRYGNRHQWLRVLLSNGVSVPIDTLLFLLIAFAGRYSPMVLFSMFTANLLIKYAVSLLSLGGVYLIHDDRE
ncbi:MAG: queuosine precursor transporter [Clostridiales bacterium]